jgi:uncharacterized protein with von Willebrand factor type A (vWA) domain
MENKFYNELRKFKKAEKVELARLKDLKESTNELSKGIDDLMEFATVAREAIAKGKRELDRLDAVKRVSEAYLDDVQKAAKDLGVDVPEAKSLERMIKAYEQQRKSLIKILN